MLTIFGLFLSSPQVWYCVSPADRAKFERMAVGLFPEEANECSDFMRHKDILISPNLLRTNNIGFTQVRTGWSAAQTCCAPRTYDGCAQVLAM